MELSQIKRIDGACFMPVFGERFPVLFTRGEGVFLYDDKGEAYLDFLAGIAVNALGYGDAGYLQTLRSQAEAVCHLSNYFYNEPQALLAQELCAATGYDKAFFTNSGGEANECALKLAFQYHVKKGAPRTRIAALTGSFHGRTLATTMLTGQEHFHDGYPAMLDMTYLTPNDAEDLRRIDESVAAVFFEPVQGEGGVIPLDEDYVRALFAVCKQAGALIVADEVQCGMGRTGTLLAQEQYGVRADIVTLAKALGGGFPVGAALCTREASAFTGGKHGSTFGGNPLACAVSRYMLSRINAPETLRHVAEMGGILMDGLHGLQKKYPQYLKTVRGRGPMAGVQMDGLDAHAVQRTLLLEKRVVAGSAGGNTLRFVPPLIIAQEHVETMLTNLEEILQCQN